MKDFGRILDYIWPQWPRLIVVVLTALLVAITLSASIITVIPLVKVMVGAEGLHSWVDRKTSEYRYGMEFYVPDTVELVADKTQQMAVTLTVTNVKSGSSAEEAGIKPGDVMLSAGSVSESEASYSGLLQELASTDANEIDVGIRRPNAKPKLESESVKLRTRPSLAPDGSRVETFQTDVKMALVGYARSAISRLDRGEVKQNRTKAVIFVMIGVLILTAIRCVAKFYQGYMGQKVVQVALTQLRAETFGHIISMPVGYFANDRASDTVSRLVRDTGSMGRCIKVLLGKALREPLNAVVMLGTAMFLNWQLTLIFLCSAPAVLGLAGTFGRKMKKASKNSLAAWSQMLGKLQETVAGLKVVKVYNRQGHERTSFGAINKRLLKQLLKMSRVDAATSPVLEVLGMMAGSLAIVFGAHWVTKANMDPEDFFAILICLGVSADAVRKSSDIWNKIQEANAAAERVFAIVDEPGEVEGTDAVATPLVSSCVEFRDVVFRYPGGERAVLNGVNLKIQAGDNVAIVGPNGSGKTTLVNLIPRFYDPDSGAILIDGRDIRDYTLKSLRQQIGMVTQNIVTFNDTVAANIGYGRPGATQEEIVEAAKRAFAHEFIEPLPAGYDTIIGEQGTGLSGGQLQRIVIARAILKDPAILIFDEATSQVDADSEAKIHKAIEEVMSDRTSLIIAHRFSTVISADTIVVMDRGRIIDQGRHGELTERCSLYRSLYETQLVKA